MNFDVDTEKMRECGQDIILITKSIQEAINGMFARLSQIPIKTHEWIGTSANEYVRRAKIDKAQYINFTEDLYRFGKLLIDYSYYFENDVKKVLGGVYD